MGRASSVCVTMSGVGVMTAESTNDASTAYLNWRSRKPGVTRPMRASTKMTTGSWNTSPRPEQEPRVERVVLVHLGQELMSSPAELAQEPEGRAGRGTKWPKRRRPGRTASPAR